MYKNKTSNRILNDSLILLCTNAITYLTTMINTRIISTNYSFVDYGTRSQMMTIVLLITSLFSFGISASPNYFLPLLESKKDKFKAIHNIYFISFIVCIISFILSWLSYDYIVSYYDNIYLYDIRIVIILLPSVRILYSIFSGVMIAQGKAAISVWISLIRATIILLTTTVLSFSRETIKVLIFGNFIVEVLICVLSIVISLKQGEKQKKWIDKGLMIKVLNYSIPLAFSTIAATLNSQIDKLFVSKLLGIKELAIYTNMSTELPFAAISGAFIAIISPYVVRKINENDIKSALNIWGKITELTMLTLSIIIFIILANSIEVIFILYSEKYIVGVDIFCIFILLEFSRITYFGLMLRSSGKSKLILYSTLLSLIINIILNFVFYYLFNLGMIGFAISTLIATYCTQLFQLWHTSRILNVEFSLVFPWNNLGKIFAINILLFAIFFVMRVFTIGYGKVSVIYSVITGILWIALYLIINRNRILNLLNGIKNI